MKVRASRIIAAFTALVCSGLFSHAILAADTEIFRNVSNVNPNLLFVIDSSGSMDGLVITSDYDSSRSITDSNCDESYVYWSPVDAAPPACDSSNKWLKNAYACNLGLDLLDGNTGFHSDTYAGWNDDDSAWQDPTTEVRTHYECFSDAGSFGALNDSSSPWPTDGDNGPWVAMEPVGDDIWDGLDEIVVYNAKYIDWYHSGSASTTTETRLEVMQSVIKDLADSLSGINIGLMNMNAQSGGHVAYPVTDIEGNGVLSGFKSAVDGISASGYTPAAETMYEALRYFRGEDVVWGTDENGTASVVGSLADSNTYQSPITEECQENNILILSDGNPTHDDGSDAAINALIAASGLAISACSHGDSVATTGTTSCLDDIAELMHKTDNSNQDGDQFVNTYSVGFLNDSPLLGLTGSDKTGGDYYTVDDEVDLQAAFQDIVNMIISDSASYVSPSVSVNSFNRVSHDNSLYYAVYEPSSTARWLGNIKKYVLDFVRVDGNKVDQDGDGEYDIHIVDANGNAAIGDDGNFDDNARSFWTHRTLENDGNAPGAGGLASRTNKYLSASGDFSSNERKVYTFTQAGESTPVTDLTDSVNRVSEDNELITGNMIGDVDISESNLSNLLKWARGVDTRNEDGDSSSLDGRITMGAPIHSNPSLVTYQEVTVSGEQVQRDIIFIPTNDGYVHAFDTIESAGNDARMELWSYIPPETLVNLKTLYDNAEQNDIEYGLDGSSDIWLNDANGNGYILGNDNDVEANEHVYYYFNQRRGGESVFALDVSDPESPEYLWTVSGNDSVTSNFYSLAQTWSKPTVHRIKMGVEVGNETLLEDREIIVFGGGYHTNHDNKTVRTSDSTGNSIYILDAKTGEILWWVAGPSSGPDPVMQQSEMLYSMASDVRIVDINGDGIADRFYAVDLGGQLWRFDFNNAEVANLEDRIKGGVIADLQLDADGDAGTEANNRRFFYPPDIALITPGNEPPFLAISIGSGLRSNPKSTAVSDRFYVIKDYYVTSPPTLESGEIGYTKLFAGDLYDVSDTVSPTAGASLTKGWYITLPNTGEKVLAAAFTFDNVVYFTTYTPAGTVNNLEACGTSGIGTGRLYATNVTDGSPVSDLDGSGSDSQYSILDRSRVLERPGIPSRVSVVFPDLEDVSPKVMVGTEVIPVEIDNPVVKTYWYQDNVH